MDKSAPRPAIKYRDLKAKCEQCGDGHPGVWETRPTTFHGRFATLRRRKCDKCGHKSRTIEMTDDAMRAAFADQVALLRARVTNALNEPSIQRKRKYG